MHRIRWLLASAPLDPPNSSALTFEYFSTLSAVLFAGLIVFVVYRIYWQRQITQIAEMGLRGVFFVSEVIPWAGTIDDWARRERIAFVPHGTAIVGSNKNGLAIWKDSHTEIVNIPTANIGRIAADGGAVVISLLSTKGDYCAELRIWPRKAKLVGFSRISPEEASLLVEELKMGILKSAT